MRMDRRGFERLIEHLAKLGTPNPVPLQAATIKLMDEDNRKGVLAGTDKDGVPLAPVKYRPKRKVVKLSDRQRNGAKARAKKGGFGGFGPMAAGLHNNLSRQEYEALSGPPLAPRGQFSRVITNYRFALFNHGPLRFGVTGMWFEIVSMKGRKFLGAHLRGKGKLPVRDIAGIRPVGMLKIRTAFRNWAVDSIRYRKGGP